MGLLDDIRLKGASYRLTEEAIFAEVVREIEAGVRRDGLWAKAFAENPESESKAKSQYIRLRVQTLKDELALARASLARSDKEAATESERASLLSAKINAEEQLVQQQLTSQREAAAATEAWNQKSSVEKRMSHVKKFVVWFALSVISAWLILRNGDSTDTIGKLLVIPVSLFFFGGSSWALLHLIEAIKKNPRR